MSPPNSIGTQDLQRNPTNKNNPSTAYIKTQKTILGHPSGLFILSSAELFERFSYYGMRALLVLYMVLELRYGDKKAYGIYGLYAALAYAAPLLGGYLADKYIGFKRAIVLGSLIIASGHFCMALPFGEAFFYMGLGLIISGTGLFKSNVSALVGMLYPKEDQRRDAGYTLFYLGINVGGFLAPLICGYIGHEYGWHYGFGSAGFGMILGALILLSKSRHFDYAEPKAIGKKSLPLTLIGGLIAAPLFAGMVYANDTFADLLPIVGVIFLIYVGRIALKASPQERQNILILLLAIFLLMLSGALVEQSGLALTLFLERNVDRHIFGWSIPTAFFQSIDPMTVLLLGGLFSMMWMKLAQKGRDLSAFSKYALGFTFVGLSYGVIYFGSILGAQSGGIAPGWCAILGMVLLSMGDICIYPVALSLCSKLAPEKDEGVMMGGVMMGVSFSYLLAGILAKFASVDESLLESLDASKSIAIYGSLFQKLIFITVICIVLTLVLGFWIRRRAKK